MSTEIIEQIADYFAWVELDSGWSMRPDELPATAASAGTAAVAEVQSVGSTPVAHRRRPFVVALLAAAAIIAVLVAIRAGRSPEPVVPAGTAPAEATINTNPVAIETTVPAADTIPAAETTTTVAVTTTLPSRPAIDTLALGESVMQAALTALTGAGVTVDATESVQARAMIARLRADLASYTVTNAVVIQVGTNGPVTEAQYDELADLVADVPRVYFLTVKAPKDWIPPNNALIRALPQTHPNVQIIDWDVSGAQIESELSAADGGIHLNSGTAVRYYSNLILGAVGKAQIPDP